MRRTVRTAVKQRGTASSEGALVWREGVSARSIGRFGGFGDSYVHDLNGFLCWMASPTTLSVQDSKGARNIIGMVKLGDGQYAAESSADWTTRRITLCASRTHEVLGEVVQSLLSPAVLFRVRSRRFIWAHDRSNQLMAYAYPTRDGLVVKESSHNREFTGGQVLAKPWILGFQSIWPDYDIPVLFVFQRMPRLKWTHNNDYHEYRFDGPAGHVFVMPLFGIERLDKKTTAAWVKRMPPDVIARCDRWASLLMEYPAGCREEYAVDEPGGVVHIRNTVSFISTRCAWPVKAQRMAPAPPLVYAAGREGYPIRWQEEPRDLGLLTTLGPLAAVPGDTVSYTVPLCEELGCTIAPVRPVNDPPREKLVRRLERYLRNPTETFGGDSTYDEHNIQDVLHNFRILAWATWSLDDAARRQWFRRMEPRLNGFRMENFVWKREPVSGRRFLAEKNIWWKVAGNAVSYDFEWYNGMLLAGLWSYVFYHEQPERALRLVAERWAMLEGLHEYFALFSDWATGTFWTDTVGEHLWMDGWHFGWQGIIGMARLAHMLGKCATYDEAVYLASKSLVSRRQLYSYNDFARRHLLDDRARAELRRNPILGGLTERGGMCVDNDSTGNTYSYSVPELFQFYLRDSRVLQALRDHEYVYAPRRVPDWNTRYTRASRSETVHGFVPLYSSWVHFYFLDARLMARAVLFREPIERLLRYTDKLTGPVLEHFLVGTTPMVVFPVSAVFRGVVWDDAARTLSVAWGPQRSGRAVVRVRCDRPPAAVSGSGNFVHSGGWLAAEIDTDSPGTLEVRWGP